MGCCVRGLRGGCVKEKKRRGGERPLLKYPALHSVPRFFITMPRSGDFSRVGGGEERAVVEGHFFCFFVFFVWWWRIGEWRGGGGTQRAREKSKMRWRWGSVLLFVCWSVFGVPGKASRVCVRERGRPRYTSSCSLLNERESR